MLALGHYTSRSTSWDRTRYSSATKKIQCTQTVVCNTLLCKTAKVLRTHQKSEWNLIVVQSCARTCSFCGLDTHGVFIKGLHVGIKLIVWLCPASKEAFLNLPHKKLHAYHSAAANRNKETHRNTFQTSLFTDLSVCFTTCIFTIAHAPLQKSLLQTQTLKKSKEKQIQQNELIINLLETNCF